MLWDFKKSPSIVAERERLVSQTHTHARDELLKTADVNSRPLWRCVTSTPPTQEPWLISLVSHLKRAMLSVHALTRPTELCTNPGEHTPMVCEHVRCPVGWQFHLDVETQPASLGGLWHLSAVRDAEWERPLLSASLCAHYLQAFPFLPLHSGVTVYKMSF